MYTTVLKVLVVVLGKTVLSEVTYSFCVTVLLSSELPHKTDPWQQGNQHILNLGLERNEENSWNKTAVQDK